MALSSAERRQLARDISRLAAAPVGEVLAASRPGAAMPVRRIGLTGPPGVGKSTLVGRLLARRATRGLNVGVLAIDPASPYSKGAILGDRIRMDEASASDHVFLRSVSSRDAQDGLCNNVADILLAMEAYRFEEVWLETVGVGQAEHAVKALVDTVVLLVQPETGDAIQALKAGILEVADVIVVTKSDLPGAARMRETLASTMHFSAKREPGWTVPVLNVAASTGEGLDELDAALAAHAEWSAQHRDPRAVAAARTRYRLRDLLQRRLDESLGALADGQCVDGDLRALYERVVETLRIP